MRCLAGEDSGREVWRGWREAEEWLWLRLWMCLRLCLWLRVDGVMEFGKRGEYGIRDLRRHALARNGSHCAGNS